jgi:hypothetical protein
MYSIRQGAQMFSLKSVTIRSAKAGRSLYPWKMLDKLLARDCIWRRSDYTATRAMDVKQPTNRMGASAALAVAFLVALGQMVWVAGCGEDARLVEHEIPHVEVATVRDQGVELGPEAAPEDVAFVLLRAIRDDVLAGSDLKARDQALRRQMAVADPDYIHARYKQVMGPQAVYGRDEWLYKTVRRWAPALAFYVDSFDFDLATARSRMTARRLSSADRLSGEAQRVELPVKHPEGVSGADVIVGIWLHKHEGGFWRAYHVGFVKTRRTSPARAAPSPAASQPAPAPATLPNSTLYK